MSALFNSYEEEFNDLSKTTQKDLDVLKAALKPGATPSTTLSSNERLVLLKTLQSALPKLKEICTNMDFESNDVLPGLRTATKQKVTEYKAQMMNIEKELTKVKQDCHNAERTELLANNGKANASAEIDPEAASGRQRLAATTENLKEGNKTLKAAERLVEETGTLGDEALVELAKQGDTLKRIKGTARDVDEEVSQVRRVLNKMHTTMMRNKAMMVCIILFLLLMIFLIIYIRVSRGSTSAPAPAPIPPPVPVSTLSPDTIPTDTGIPFNPAGAQ